MNAALTKAAINFGSSFNYSDLQNLSREQAVNGGAVKFSLVREAGTIDCEGSFANGKGAGTFRFTSNPQFVSAMKTRGFDFEAETSRRKNQILQKDFSPPRSSVTTALADDLLSAISADSKSKIYSKRRFSKLIRNLCRK